jgi:nucleotide-binding universal stress UspA family protein
MERLYSHILVPTNFTPACREAYQVALAAAHGTNARVTLLHVLPEPDPDEYTGMDAFRLLHRAAERRPLSIRPPADDPEVIDEYIRRLRAEVYPEWTGPVGLNFEVRRGDTVAEIANYAAANDVDLIVMVSDRPRRLLGGVGKSLADRLARATPVRIIRVTPSRRQAGERR